MVKRGAGLTTDDWVAAGLDALEAGGIGAVAVEPLARQLGATKGSFYWHFRNRSELVVGVLELWEQRYVTDAIARLRTIADPRKRLRALFTRAVTPGMGRIDVELSAAARLDAQVAAVVRRVQEMRVAFLAETYEELGLATRDARLLSVLALLAQSGMSLVGETAPELIPSGKDLATLQAFLVPRG